MPSKKIFYLFVHSASERSIWIKELESRRSDANCKQFFAWNNCRAKELTELIWLDNGLELAVLFLGIYVSGIRSPVPRTFHSRQLFRTGGFTRKNLQAEKFIINRSMIFLSFNEFKRIKFYVTVQS